MSYIQSNTDTSPFCTVDISGSNTLAATGSWDLTTAFDTPNKNWASYVSGSIETTLDTLAFAAFSPITVLSAGSFMFSDYPLATDQLKAQVFAESSAGGAGGLERGDDQSIKVGTAHRPQYLYITPGVSQAPDLNRSIMHMIAIGS